MQNENILRVGIYCRVSTQEQADEGYSLGEQEARLRAYCDARSWIVSDVYVDGGFSGGNTKRPALQKLINDTKKKKIDLVLVYKLDRLSRSQKDTLFLIEDVFNKNNVAFVSMSENFDTSTPFGKAMIGILSVFAQLEREQIKERMNLGRYARAKSGLFHGSTQIPKGYDYINGKLVINEYEAMQVRECFDLLLKGTNYYKICKILHDKYGEWDYITTVKGVLTNKIYIGLIKHNDEYFEGQHDAIIDNETFERANHLVNKISSSERYNVSKYTKYLLTGLVYCGKCGLRFGILHKKGSYRRKDGLIPYHYVYYGCYARIGNKVMSKGTKCNNPVKRIEDLEMLVINEIKKLQFNMDYLEELAGIEKENTTAENIKILREKIKEYNKQLDKLMDLYQLENIPLDVVANKIKAVSEAKDNVEARISELEKENTSVDMNEIRDIVSSASEILDGDDSIKKRELVRSLIDKIVVDEDKVTIYWSFS